MVLQAVPDPLKSTAIMRALKQN